MNPADLQVKTALIRAGFVGRPMGCRGALYEILEELLREDPEGNDDLVDELRSLLRAADVHERQAALEAIRLERSFIKACPECGQKPDLGPGHRSSTGEVVVICSACMTLEGVVMQGGQSLIEAIDRWNDDDWAVAISPRESFLL